MTGNSPQFTNANPRLREDFSQAALCFPGVKVRLETSQGTRTPTVYVTADLHQIRHHRQHFAAELKKVLTHSSIPISRFAQQVGVSPSLVQQWMGAKTSPSLATFQQLSALLQVESNRLAPHGPFSLVKNGRNALTRWLDEQGVWGKDAAHKTIPDCVYRYSRPRLALFLNRLFACDGSVYLQNQSQPAISYSTVS